ncbi:vanadium-dependent haloperoxidase [Roseisolibacter sp. H3M3-2]|uniref:vanadium-dependent haloperoxidase n=1 Tax=Roseisolibacter sp. H3M3-2 TaxID=3031323 RepID=UPI0023DA4A49|nr:vanadium-dependent haloperoxidase [Roseisolibacter sp. H3M3-2]MDF1503914.1 vanadium-dependent haloperoxidase [Roseisolibacter sp. H3M3-2]
MRASAALAAALVLAGCAADRPPTAALAPDAAPSYARAAACPAAEPTTASARWTRLADVVVGRNPRGPLFAARNLALIAVAQYNAVIAAEDEREGRLHPSVAGAAAGASAAMLVGLYASEQGAADAQLAADAAYFPSLPSERDADWAEGVAVGREVAAAVLAYASADGSAAVSPELFPTGPTSPGAWYSAVGTAPVAPLWGQVRPWVLPAGDAFRPPPPPAFGSPAYLAEVAMVRAASDTRTPAQLAIARKWGTADVNPAGGSGIFSDSAIARAERHHLDERATARLLAVLAIAQMDASIGCWEAKYHYRTIRPWQVDAAITTPIGRPNFPSYPSGHSCVMGAAGAVLAGFFPPDGELFAAMVAEAGVSRVYAGLHFPFDIPAGQRLGRAVGALALANAPRGHAPIPLD